MMTDPMTPQIEIENSRGRVVGTKGVAVAVQRGDSSEVQAPTTGELPRQTVPVRND